MKTYEIVGGQFYDDAAETWNPVPDGMEYVPAEVAERLYEALKKIERILDLMDDHKFGVDGVDIYNESALAMKFADEYGGGSDERPGG